jgi:hypothetical protein
MLKRRAGRVRGSVHLDPLGTPINSGEKFGKDVGA